MVRIVGGRSRGLKLDVPKGQTVRPTSDRVREAIFNVLAHRFPGRLLDALVLDLFAGSGALGIEALSRGAGYVDFVEKSRDNARLIRRNAHKVSQDFTLTTTDAARFLSGSPKTYDLIFLDPPYHEEYYTAILGQILTTRCLAETGLVYIESPSGLTIELPDGLTDVFERQYGSTNVKLVTR